MIPATLTAAIALVSGKDELCDLIAVVRAQPLIEFYAVKNRRSA